MINKLQNDIERYKNKGGIFFNKNQLQSLGYLQGKYFICYLKPNYLICKFDGDEVVVINAYLQLSTAYNSLFTI